MVFTIKKTRTEYKSYVDGKNKIIRGNFKSRGELLKKLPAVERTAFSIVMSARKRTGRKDIDSVRDIGIFLRRK